MFVGGAGGMYVLQFLYVIGLQLAYATTAAIVGTLTLVLQTLCFSHILKRSGFHGTLLRSPRAHASKDASRRDHTTKR